MTRRDEHDEPDPRDGREAPAGPAGPAGQDGRDGHDEPFDVAPVERRMVDGDGVRLHVRLAGPPDGPPLLLLHGFPEGAACWRRQVGPFARAGFRVWVPEQRGYGRSDAPRGVASYRLDRLAADAAALVVATGRPRASIVAHDWGGAVAWWLAETAPERIDRLVVLNCPHPDVLRRALLTDPRQMLRSWYIAFFQLPRVPEWAALRQDARLLVQGLRDSSRPGTFDEAAFAALRREWTRPGAMRAMIDWYRALRLRVPVPARRAGGARPPIDVPTLLVWGARDRALGRRLAGSTIARCARGRLVVLEQATHWLQHEESARVNALCLEHLREAV